ncbi:MAG: cytochrome c biogenesis protein CcsA [Lautropia sp.]|nr:cytochrome c biogenesis protein CcsA [Lautropia sp.]
MVSIVLTIFFGLLLHSGLPALLLYGLTAWRYWRREPALLAGTDGAAAGRGAGSAASATTRVSAPGQDGRAAVQGPGLDPWMFSALLAHAAALAGAWVPSTLHFGFAYLLSATLWIALFLIWLESWRVSLGRLPMLLSLLAMPVVVLPRIFPGQAFPLDQQAPLFVPHLVVGTLAYGMVFMAALVALVMAAAEHRLHPRRKERGSSGLAALIAKGHRTLPPLMVLERILFQVISVAFVLLLLTTVSGVVFSEEIFGRPLPLNHKTVFSLVATVFFGLLLVGRWLWGWRGRLAIRLTLGGFILLLLSYVGSRFVMEVVLQRI